MTVMEEMLETLKRIEKKLDDLPAAAGEGKAELIDGKATMTAQELADLLGVTRQTVYDQTKQGRIPHFKAGAKLLYPKKAVMRWMMEEAEKNCTRDKELDTSDIDFDLTG